MSQSLAKNLIHLIFSTKHRAPLIPKETRERLFAYQAGIFKDWACPALAIGGVADHVHALFCLAKTQPLKTIVEEVKKGSSKWMKTREGCGNAKFYWQKGYAAFSVSQSNTAAVVRYIDTQEEHHRVKTFQDELRALCKRHEVDLDERYAWD
ncbi:transposase [Candidatus Laterigemmans baculatus]|uniref:transposase n=1 Tax=Candidatus Laterigemmans baculatus TaxID=2770505 RepID=UPI0013DA01FF|nr:transposase [Candidatus Laterigemmans baculatus]